MKFRCSVVALTAAAVLLFGCGGDEGADTAEKRTAECPQQAPAERSQEASEQRGKGPRKAWIGLDGRRSAENVSILMAAQRGYFADAGISVTITSPISPTRSIGYVTDGFADFGVSHQPEVVIAKQEGTPIVAVGSLIPDPTAAMIWLSKSKIRDLADLEGKTIAIPGLSFQEGLLQSVLETAGLTLDDVEVESVGYELVPALVSGDADAIFGGSWNVEGAELEARGLKPVVTRAQSLGVPAYDELVVITRSDRAAEEPGLVRDLMSAIARGAAAAAGDPEEDVKIIEESSESDPQSTPKTTRAAVEATLPLLSRDGYMDPGQAGRLVDWMCGEELIERKPAISELFTNEYLPSRP